MGMRESSSTWRLYFRKEFFTPWYEPGNDIQATDLTYQQIMRGVSVGEYKCDKVDTIGMSFTFVNLLNCTSGESVIKEMNCISSIFFFCVCVFSIFPDTFQWFSLLFVNSLSYDTLCLDAYILRKIRLLLNAFFSETFSPEKAFSNNRLLLFEMDRKFIS